MGVERDRKSQVDLNETKKGRVDGPRSFAELT